MTHYVTDSCRWVVRTTKTVCTKAPAIAKYLYQTRCGQACVEKAIQCWTNHNSEFKYAIVASSTALITSGSWLVTPLVAGTAAFAVTKGIKHHTAVAEFVVPKIKKSRDIIHCCRSTNDQIHAEIVSALAAKDVAKLLTLSRYTYLLTENERNAAVIEFSKPPTNTAGKEKLLSSLLIGRLSNDAITAGLRFAIQQKNPNLIRILLRNNILTKQQILAALMFACIPSTPEEVINALLSQGITLLEPKGTEFRLALIYMATNGYEKAFQTILKAVDFSGVNLVDVLKELILIPDHTKKAQFIYEFTVKFPDNALLKDHSCVFAITTKNNNLLKSLLSKGPNLTSAQLSALIIHAATFPSSSFIQNVIVSFLKHPDISNDAKSKSLPLLADAVCNGREKLETLVAVLQPPTRIVESDRKRAIQTACLNGNVPILDQLLQGFTINRQFKAQLLDICNPSIRPTIDGLPATR
jgi:hypothetical protein